MAGGKVAQLRDRPDQSVGNAAARGGRRQGRDRHQPRRRHAEEGRRGGGSDHVAGRGRPRAVEYRKHVGGIMVTRALTPRRRRAQVEREDQNGKNPCDHEGERRRGRRPGRTAHAAGAFHPREPAAHRHPYRLRDHPLRRLHRRSRRHVGQELHGVRGAGPGLRHHDHRGRGQCRRFAVGAAGRLPHDARPAMRLLHARA